MCTRTWVIGIVVLIIAAVIAGPSLYKAARGGDDAPVTTISLDETEAAVDELDGTWAVVPGDGANRTVAGYTVDEILNGEPVTVVGSTDQVTGRAEISGYSLTSAEFETRMDGLATDNSSRDNRARSPEILDAAGHPVSTLTLAAPVDLTSLPSDGTAATLPMNVELTIKGVTVPKTVEVTVLRSGEQLIASGSVPVTWAEVNVQAPSLGFVTVDPDGTVDFRVTLEKN